MVYWAPVLHFYQPPTQFPAVLKRICDESYRPLIALLGEFERARATVNINGSLTEMLLNCGHKDVVAGLRRLAEQGRVELLGSGMYHPILPLIPGPEIVRQIELNHATNRRAFGDVYAPRGSSRRNLRTARRSFRPWRVLAITGSSRPESPAPWSGPFA